MYVVPLQEISTLKIKVTTLIYMPKSIMRFCAEIAAYSWAICRNVSVALHGNLADGPVAEGRAE